MEGPHRCPHCDALIVDRRSLVCTTCKQELPDEFVMTDQQAARTTNIDLDEGACSLDLLEAASELFSPTS